MINKTIYYKSEKCVVCGRKELAKYLSLGKQAPANAYLPNSKLKFIENKFPLDVYFCKYCYLAQLLGIVDRSMLFSDYAYFSSTSPMLVKHFEKYAQRVFKKFTKQAKKLVVDIGSNDGVLLHPFKKLGANVLGVDPAKNIADYANSIGIETLPIFFNEENAKKIVKKYGKAGIITSNNTLAHTDAIHSILDGVKELLDSNGVFVFEFQYVKDLLKHNEFDNTYHEHICYYSLWPIIQLLRYHSLDIFDVEHDDTHGGSLIVYASHPFTYKITDHVYEIIEQERKDKIYDIETYRKFAENPLKVKKKLVDMVKKFRKQGKKVVGYGASAKCTTLLQYCNFNINDISYITDSAPSKQGKYTPGTHIPIVEPEILKKNVPDIIIIFAWNYAQNIIEKEKWFIEKGGKFIIPIPEPKLVG